MSESMNSRSMLMIFFVLGLVSAGPRRHGLVISSDWCMLHTSVPRTQLRRLCPLQLQQDCMYLTLPEARYLSSLGLGVIVTSDGHGQGRGVKTQRLGNPELRTELIVEVQYVNESKPKIPMDNALISISNNLSFTVEIWSQVDVCWNCPPLLISMVPSNTETHILADTRWPINITVWNGTDNVRICSLHYHFGEYGEYHMDIEEAKPKEPCPLWISKQPTNSFIPIYLAMALLVLCGILYTIAYQIHRKKLLRRLVQCQGTEGLIDSDLGTANSSNEDITPDRPTSPHTVLVTKPRIKSLDTFRGVCLLLMVFVNYGGGKYWFFKHSVWNGLTVADLVFPWFTFIMGTSIALSVRSLLRRGNRRVHLVLKVLKRTAILFALGLLISNSGAKKLVDVRHLRIPGVLQRLAVSYLVVALMEVCFAQAADVYQAKWWAPVRDLLTSWHEWLISLSILTVHIALTFLLPVPNCPKGYLGPGGLHDNAEHMACTGGAAGYIDRVVFGEEHMYHHPTCMKMYRTTVPFDPEGILGTLTSIFICFLGLQAGKILNTFPSHNGRVIRWLIWALVYGALAGILCKFSVNDGWIPVNKNLWSVSFILALASMSFFFLTICYLLCDMWNVWSGTPFFYPGMNSILIYLGHEILHRAFPVQFHVASNHPAQLAMNLYGAALWLIVSIVLYHKRIFIAI